MINPRKAYTYFNSTFGIKKTTNGWWSFDCPFCIKRKPNKMAVHFDIECVKCFLCEYKSSIVDYVMDYENLKYWEAKDFIESFDESSVSVKLIAETNINMEVVPVELPYGYTGIMQGEGTLGNRARKYLIDRGFSLESVDRLGFGYCNESHENYLEDYFGRIIVPFKRRGRLVYYTARSFIGDALRYKNPPTEKFGIGKADLIFNEDALELYDTIFITEGWADALTFGKLGTSTQGWSMSNYQKGAYKKSSCKNMVFVPDAGTDGQGYPFYLQALKMASEFLDLKEEVYVVDLNPLAEGDNKDANSIGRDKVLEVLKTLEPLNFSSIINISNEYTY